MTIIFIVLTAIAPPAIYDNNKKKQIFNDQNWWGNLQKQKESKWYDYDKCKQLMDKDQRGMGEPLKNAVVVEEMGQGLNVISKVNSS